MGIPDLLVDESELQQRRDEWKPRERHHDRGYGRLFLESVLQADEGCDFSFLRGTGRKERKLPLAF